MSTNAAPTRMPAGPKLQLEVTEAITNAFFEELADVGYGRLSIDAVARRAGAPACSCRCSTVCPVWSIA